MVGVANHSGIDTGVVPGNHVKDGSESEVGVNVSSNNPGRANAPERASSVNENTQLRLLSALPILLGVFICALNILAAVRLWLTVYGSDFTWFSRINLPNTVFLTLITISFFIGLFLIAYASILRRFERNRHESKIPQEPLANHEPGQVPSYVKWILVPLLVALPAPALTVWAAQMIEPIAPIPCIELYQEALEIKKDNPNFAMSGYDRDQFRCDINYVITR